METAVIHLLSTILSSLVGVQGNDLTSSLVLEEL